MTAEASPNRGRTSPRRRVILLFAVIAVLFGGWYLVWRYAAGRINVGLDGLMQEAAQQGASLTCASRRLTGFPFQFEIDCATPTLRIPDGVTASARRLRAVAMVWRPLHAIVEIDGPVLLTPRQGTPIELRAASLMGSIHVEDGLPQGVALVGKAVEVRAPGAPAAQAVASLAELHLRPDPDFPGDLDVAAAVEGLVVARPQDRPIGPLDASLAGRAVGLIPAIMADGASGLRTWIAEGAPVRDLNVRASAGTLTAEGSAVLALDPLGRLEGRGTLALSGLDTLKGAGTRPAAADRAAGEGDGGKETAAAEAIPGAAGLESPPAERLPPAVVASAAALSFTGRHRKAGDRTLVDVPVEIRAGRLSLGGLHILDMPPLALP